MNQNEKPLDNWVSDGGLCAIFRTVGCIGDSLASGEFVSHTDAGNNYHDYYEYSWGQFMARKCGFKAYNFSRGGMTANAFNEFFGKECGFEDEDKVCQAYIVALGVNDLLNCKMEVGSADDLDLENPDNNKRDFAGEMGRILSKIKAMQPKARIFLVTIPNGEWENEYAEQHANLMYALAERYEYTYVIDLYKYGPVYDDEFKNMYYLDNHMNAAGYLFTANMFASYIDYIIRHNPDDFRQIGFVGTPFHNDRFKW